MNEQTRALFEAHVAHELAALTGRDHDPTFSQLSENLFEWFAGVKLDDLLTPAQVLGVIDRYVIDLRISGGITELIGQLAQTIFTSDASADTRIDQLFSYDSYRDFADKIQSLDGALHEVIQLISRTRSFQPLLARAIMLAARSVLFERGGQASERERQAKAPLGQLVQLGRELRDDLTRRLEEQLTRYLEQHGERLASASETGLHGLLDPDTLRSLADELWDAVASMRLSELFALLSPSDMEDFVVLVYETWLKYRHTPYFRVVSQQVVEAFFQKYGGESMLSLLDDMGVDHHMVAHELHVLVAPMLAHAARTGMLEQQVRARLEPFYRSDTVANLLAR